MINRFIKLLILLTLLPLCQGASAADWIWAAGDRDGEQRVLAKREFVVEGDIAGATLRAAGDFCSVDILLNGQRVGRIHAYDDQAEIDVRHLLKTGRNRLEVEADGVPGPSAFALQIDGIAGDGKEWSMVTDSDWRVSAGEGGRIHEAVSFGALASLDWHPAEQRPDIGAYDEYNQWKEALGAAGGATAAVFSNLPEGFEIEVLRVAQDEEGSWVSMAIDERGRIILAREKRGLLRLTLSQDGKSVTGVEVVDDTLLECRGLLFAHGALYANANNSKALYRLRDTDGDDKYDEVIKLRETGGGVGHGRNDLALGPDGMIYVIHGDSVQIPDDALYRTPPTVERFRKEGHLIRTDPKGETWEVIACGLRNPFGIDFNPHGEVFTYDADNESDIGLPFYRPTRVNHLVSGTDYGWRQGAGSWPVYAPDSLPTSVDIGHGSPTAVKFGTRSHFPERYRDALFVFDWAYGRIIAVDTVPRGASYVCRAQTFLRGRPLNVTDLEFGPDGAMYFVTGGRKTRSGLYRVRYTGPREEPVALTRQQEERRAFSEKSRELRRSLEAHHDSDAAEVAIEQIWTQLNNRDPWVRHAALVALQHQPLERWRPRALLERKPDIATTALLGLSRVDEDGDLPEVMNRLLEFDFGKLDRQGKLCVLRSYEILRRRGCPCGEVLEKRIIGQTAESFPSGDSGLDRELARLLLALNWPDAVAKCLDLLARAKHQPDKLFYMDVLSRSSKAGWTTALRSAYFRSLRTMRTFTGDRSLAGFTGGIRERAKAAIDEKLEGELFAAIVEEPGAGEVRDIADSGRDLVNEWKLADLADVIEAEPKDRAQSVRDGERVFTQALCSHCHQIGSIGTPVGPNLTAVSSRFARRDLLESMIEPSSVVAEIFQNHLVKKKDGTVLVGRVIHNNLRDSSFTLAPNPFAPWQTVKVSKHEVESREISPASPMPAGLLNYFTKDEIVDLIAYIEAGGETGVPSREEAKERLRKLGAQVFIDFKSHAVTEVLANGNEKIADADLQLLLAFDSITDVSLENTGIGDDGMVHLGALKELEWLNLFRTKVGDAGLEHLSGSGSLKLLPIGNTMVTDAGLAHAARMEQLEYLGLRGNKITDAGLVHLAGLKNLKGLHLGETGIGDAGVAHLAGLKKLEQLWLHDTGVTDASVEVISGFTKLKELHIGNTTISPEGLGKLRRALPRCEIEAEVE